MKRQRPRTKRLKLPNVGRIEAHRGWSNAALTFTHFDHVKGNREVTIGMDSPWAVLQLQKELGKIAKYWKDSLAANYEQSAA